MSTTALTFRQDGPNIVIVSTAAVGPPGSAGPPGEAGEQGSSGLPGTQVNVEVVSGDPVIEINTLWWIDDDGNPQLAATPQDVPAGKEAWFDPSSFTVVPGLPGPAVENNPTPNIPADAAADVASLRTLGSGPLQAMPGDTPLTEVGSIEWLQQVFLSNAFNWALSVYDSNQTLLSASVVWPDGTAGRYAADAISTTFPGLVDAYHITYEPDIGAQQTISQPTVSRNGAGYITVSPSLVVGPYEGPQFMAVAPSQVTVNSSTPLQLDTTPETDVQGTGSSTFSASLGQTVWVDVGATDIYIGGDNTVTSSGAKRGKLTKAGTSFQIDLYGSNHLWAITASGTSVCEILQVGV